MNINLLSGFAGTNTGDSSTWVLVLAGLALGISAVVIIIMIIAKNRHND